MASSLVSTRTQEWEERCFSGHPPSPGGQSHSSQDRVAYAWDSRGPCSLPSLRCYRQTPLLLSEGRLGKTVSGVAGRRQCQFPSWESGLGRNVLAGSAGSLYRTPARSGGRSKLLGDRWVSLGDSRHVGVEPWGLHLGGAAKGGRHSNRYVQAVWGSSQTSWENLWGMMQLAQCWQMNHGGGVGAWNTGQHPHSGDI